MYLSKRLACNYTPETLRYVINHRDEISVLKFEPGLSTILSASENKST